MNIVCYINKLSLGGAERVMSIIANELQQRGHHIVMVTDYQMKNEYELDGAVKRIILDGDFRKRKKCGVLSRTVRRIWALRRICSENKADIILSFIDDANLRAMVSTVGLKTKNVISVRVDPNMAYRSKLSKALFRTLYAFADGCVFQTDDALHWYPEKVQCHACVILNPISQAFYKKNGAPGKEKRIASCGRLAKQKNHSLLIRAFQPIAQDIPDVTLDIFGTGALKDELEQQIKDLNLDGRVILRGQCNDVSNAIKDYSCFVLSSDFEGLPNALMEAMALGLPVVSTDCGGGGARVLIDNGKNGFIVPCNDAVEMEKAIRFCLCESPKALEMGQMAYKTALNFSQERIITQWENYMAEVANQ